MDVGFYGKLPSHGDFLRGRVSDAFVTAWDAWLQECLPASRAALGDRWLDVYLTSPAWRFACAAGTCGDRPAIGVMAPSVDRVGRYFPLTLVAELPPHVSLLTVATEAVAFFDRAERLVIETLEADHVDFQRFDAGVAALAEALATIDLPQSVTLDPAATAMLTEQSEYWRLPIGSADTLGLVFAQLLSHKLAATYAPLTLWWTEGSFVVEPSCLVVKGLPDPEAFAALLDGAWAQYGWPSVPARVERALSLDERPSEGTPRVGFRSAAASDVGRARQVNQDAFLERPEVGLWAVADGLGGHSDGEVASRMVCDALADFAPASSFDDTIESVRQRMSQVNEHLLRTATRSLLADRCGSTVVMLLVRGAHLAVLWAGDSRVYRWRMGRLDHLTRDHSLSPAGRPESTVVTRAVGAESTLTLDLVRDEVRAGDRFLLCSDGLTRMISDTEIQVWMEHPDVRGAVDGLIKATLDAGAPDNVTVLIAEAFADSI